MTFILILCCCCYFHCAIIHLPNNLARKDRFLPCELVIFIASSNFDPVRDALCSRHLSQNIGDLGLKRQLHWWNWSDEIMHTWVHPWYSYSHLINKRLIKFLNGNGASTSSSGYRDTRSRGQVFSWLVIQLTMHERQ